MGDDIREFVSFPECKTLNEIVEKAREQEMELEFRTKQKPEQAQTTVSQAKKPKTLDSSSKGQQGRGRCAKCGRSRSGACWGTSVVVYTCGHPGHVSRDCPKKGLICFHCNKTGHKKVECPRLQEGGGVVVVPVPATLRITDGHLAKADAPAMKIHAFQLTTEEARATPDVMAGTDLFVNGMSSHVLFDSGATQSFVSLALSKKFWDASGTLGSPLEVEIADSRTVSVARVYRDCVLNVLGERFRVDLVPIPLRGMDWLGLMGP
ncbi:uncharacterized protein LOC111910095 [Lactuca sativa]|uniref:uncharacterized protein LOC111910095 n=1 Tax=Lactuca sativa TaxID=4236 RepID=UPI000CD8863E|nr:uncharacterized protein LOC111910095 [Lactuca sativa]